MRDIRKTEFLTVLSPTTPPLLLSYPVSTYSDPPTQVEDVPPESLEAGAIPLSLVLDVGPRVTPGTVGVVTVSLTQVLRVKDGLGREGLVVGIRPESLDTDLFRGPQDYG